MKRLTNDREAPKMKINEWDPQMSELEDAMNKMCTLFLTELHDEIFATIPRRMPFRPKGWSEGKLRTWGAKMAGVFLVAHYGLSRAQTNSLHTAIHKAAV